MSNLLEVESASAPAAATSWAAPSGFVYAPYTSSHRNGLVPPSWVERYEREAANYWDLFYRRNADRFFKDRHYLQAEWSELRPDAIGLVPGGSGSISSPDKTRAAHHNAEQQGAEQQGAEQEQHDASQDALEVSKVLEVSSSTGELVLLEAGCGVGNTLIPLLHAHPRLRVLAFDFSRTAVDIVKQHELHQSGRVVAAVGDLTSGVLPPELGPAGQAHLATLMFVLSAICPAKMPAAIAAVASGLREGGVVLFRDYGIGDGAQLRLEKSKDPKKLQADAPFFVRQDGTRAYYFRLEELTELFRHAGFAVLQCEYSLRQTTNKVKGITLERKFITARFAKQAALAT